MRAAPEGIPVFKTGDTDNTVKTLERLDTVAALLKNESAFKKVIS
jgi:hypothetical protein